MNSKIGNLAKPAPQIWTSEAAPKQLNLNKLSDAGGSKYEDVRRSQKPIFEFICVYLLLFFCYSLEATVHVIGDSHSQEFANIQDCKIHYLGPRTMHRIGRDGVKVIDFKKLAIQEEDTVVLAFGEIDVRCHIGKQRDLCNRELNEILDTLLAQYFRTITDNLAQYNHLNIVTYTVTPPVLVAWNIEYESYGPLEERVAISKLLNQKLIEKSMDFGFKTIDVYNDYADENGMLREELSDGSVHIATSCNQAIQRQLFGVVQQ